MPFEEVTAKLDSQSIPYREIGPCLCIHGDSLVVLPLIDAGTIDAVVTDPPYGIGDKMQGGTWGAAQKYSDFRKWDVAPTDETLKSLIDVAPQSIIWGGNYFAMSPSRCWLIWDKSNAVPTMADVEMAWTNLDQPAKRYRGQVGVHKFGHPTEKPLALMVWCLKWIAGETILDPYAGSFTTGVACIQTDRRAILIELDAKYFDVGCQRIERAWQLKRSELPFEAPVEMVQGGLFGE